MDLGEPFYVIAASVLCQIFCQAVSQRCDQGEYSIFGKMLKGHVFKKIKVPSPAECLQACNDDLRCQSFNYVINQDVCEMNNRSKEARPEDFVPDFNRYYFKSNGKTGKFTKPEAINIIIQIFYFSLSNFFTGSPSR